MYKKRASGHSIPGQLYETKLLSLILFRALHNNDIEEFCMGSNLENAHHFDDICIKAKVKGHDRPLVLFLQVKHREQDRISILNPIDIVKFFKSYAHIKQSFDPKSKDIFFNEDFNNTECFCILYTNAKCDFKRDDLNSPFANLLAQLLGTSMIGGSQLCLAEDDVQILETELLKYEFKVLAKQFAKYISTERNELMMNDEYILRYHVILAQKVLHVSKVDEQHSVCTFRHDFFETTDKYLLLFKEELYQNIFESLQSKHNPTNISYVNEFLSYPSEITLINVIGSDITYKNNELKFISNVSNDLKKKLSLINLPHSTINNAINTVTMKKLKSLTFKVPFIFGNTDLVLSGSLEKHKKRIDFLAHKIEDLIKISKPSCIVSIDDTIPIGLLRLNGGLAAAVGNLLVYDNESGLLKFTDDCSSLEPNAKYLLAKLKDNICDLQNYRFQVNTKKFPKLTVSDHYNKHLVKNFLSKLMLWTEQASHEVIEKILIEEIENHEYSKTDHFRTKSDAIFLNYHNIIQKWWMSSESHCLTKEQNAYQLAVEDISKNQLIRIISIMSMRQITSAEYSFNEEELDFFCDFFSKSRRVFVVTNITILTVIKVIQCLSKMKIYNAIVLDLRYVFEMLTEELNALVNELKRNEYKQILILFGDLTKIPYCSTKLQKFITEISDNEIVIIVNKTDTPMMRQWVPKISKIIYDKKHNLEDLGETSQLKILNNTEVSFQGENITLSDLVDGLPTKFIEGSVLRKAILKENIVIGGSLTNSSYDKNQHLFVDRKVIREKVLLELLTLSDIKDDIVILTGKPGIGKSTLLTHLAVKTKKINYKLWIVHINFLDCVKYFNKWQKYKTTINTLEMFKFMCHVVLQSIKPGYDAKVSLQIERNGDVCLLDLDVDDDCATFELRLFLHFYMKRNVILLFDGFDEISPYYTETVIAFLKVVKDDIRRNKIWISSRSCNEISMLIESRFGKHYELNCFDENELHTFLNKFWKKNLILSNFDKEHIGKFENFLDKTELHLAKHSTTILTYPLGCVLVSLILYLVTNFRSVSGRNKWHILYKTIPHNWKHISIYQSESTVNNENLLDIKTPLLAYLSAKHFSDYIKHSEDETYDTLFYKISLKNIYEEFVENKVLNHFLNNKKLDIYDPNISMEYNEELQKLMNVYTNEQSSSD